MELDVLKFNSISIFWKIIPYQSLENSEHRVWKHKVDFLNVIQVSRNYIFKYYNDYDARLYVLENI